MTRRALMVVLVAVGASLVVPAVPAPAETTVDPNGSVVTITIPVDIVGAKGQTSPDGTMSLVEYWEKILNDTWGAAFGMLPYKNCYRFELRLKLTERGRGFDATEGRHRILVAAETGGLTFDGVGFEGAKETSRRHDTGDGTRSMEHDRDGAIPVDAAPRVIAHEFGHLFGLGQDTVEGGRPADTVMVGGESGVDLSIPGRIDRNLIDRIGKIIERYLKDQGKKPLAKCQVWNGTITQTGDFVSCTSTATSPVQFGVTDDEVDVTIAFTEVESDCPVPTAELWGTGVVKVRVARNSMTVESEGPLLSGTVDRSGDRINGTYTNPLPGGDATYPTTWELRCVEGCREAVG